MKSLARQLLMVQLLTLLMVSSITSLKAVEDRHSNVTAITSRSSVDILLENNGQQFYATLLNIDDNDSLGSEITRQYRRGPAYDRGFWRNFYHDAMEYPEVLWYNTKKIPDSQLGFTLISVGVFSAIAINGKGIDKELAERKLASGQSLSPTLSNIGDEFGKSGTHYWIAVAFYALGAADNNESRYEIGRTMIHALLANSIVTLSLKGAVNRKRPRGSPHSWPSGHTSSSFTLASVLNEYYGPLIGIPAIAFAGFVGYQRIDSSRHYLSDVISGALIGYSIGYVFSNSMQNRGSNLSINPYKDHTGQFGLSVSYRL